MLDINLNHIFKARGIDNPYSFLVKAGMTYHSANALLYTHKKVFRLDQIEFLCSVLNCEPNDLLFWNPDKKKPLPPTHPLYKLKKENVNFDLRETLDNMSFEELKKVAKSLKKED